MWTPLKTFVSGSLFAALYYYVRLDDDAIYRVERAVIGTNTNSGTF